MKELTLKQKKEALKYILREFKNKHSHITFICECFKEWYLYNIEGCSYAYEYMKSFPELLNAIERRLIRQKKEVSYSSSGRITGINALVPRRIDPFKYRVSILRKIQKEVNK